MKSGNLTDNIVFEKKASSTASNGDLISIWTTRLTTLADVEIMSGEDQVKAGKVVSQNRIKIKIRYRTDVTLAVGDRVTWRQRKFLVEPAIVTDKKRTFFTMTAIVEFETT